MAQQRLGAGVLVVLLVLEFVADKVPVLDTSTTSSTRWSGPPPVGSRSAPARPPRHHRSGHRAAQWVPIAVGAVLALVVHLLKALVRPVLNAMTAGVGAPLVSTAEDVTSVTMSLAAILLPVLVLFFLVGLCLFFWWALRRRARRRAARRHGYAGPVGGPG